MMAKKEPILDAQDLLSSTWLKLNAYLEKRADKHRRMNDNDLSVESTYKLRGRIAEVKAILNLANPHEPHAED